MDRIEHPETRRRVRILLVLQILVLVLAIALVGSDVLQQGVVLDAEDPAGNVVLVAAVLVAVSAWLTWRGSHEAGGVLLVGTAAGAVWVAAAFGDGDPTLTLVYLALPVLLSGAILGVRTTAVLAAATVVSAALPVFSLTTEARWSVATFLVVTNAVAVVAAHLRDRDLRQLTDQTLRLEEAQEMAGVGDFTLDLDTGRASMSDQLREVYGVPGTERDLSFDGFMQLVHPDDREEVRRVAETLAEDGGERALDHRIVRPDGTVRWTAIRVRALPVGSDQPEELRGTAQDITDRVRLEELERKRAEDRGRIEELERVLRLVTHELREPLRNITGHAQLLARRLGDALDAEAAEDIDHLERAVRQMDRTLHAATTYVEVATTSPVLQRVDPAKALDEARSALEREGVLGDAVVEQGDLPPVQASPGHLRRVFVELLENAIVHHDGGDPHVRVTGRTDGDRVVLTVRDDGPGIAPAHHERIFELFQQLERDEDRSGLGLALVRRIVKALGGDVWVESEEGDGAAFHVALRAAGSPGAP